MTIDALALAAICSEAEDLLVGGRIQKIIPVGPLAVAFEIYSSERHRRIQFLMSADPQNARFHVLNGKVSQAPGQPDQFLLLLRKYVRFGIITNVEQTPFERVVTLTIAKKFPAEKKPHVEPVAAVLREVGPNFFENDSDDEEEGETTDENAVIYESRLVCEIMGRHSNILLLSEDDVIIEVIKRVAPSKNRYRMILPRQLYVAPPPQDKRQFNLETAASFAALLDKQREANPQAQLWQVLVANFAGVSPQLAKEVSYRLAEKKGQNPDEVTLGSILRWDTLYSELYDLLKPLDPKINSQVLFQPTVVRRGEDEDNIIAFAPYQLRQFRSQGLESQPIDSVSHAAELFYAQIADISGQAQRKQQIAEIINEHQERLSRRLASMEGSLKKAESAEELRQKGEAIYAHLYEIQPGDTELKAENLKIKLNPDRSPSENAQDYFREYAKSKQALEGVPELVQETRYELEYLDEMLTQLELAESYEDVVNIKAELTENGFGQKPTAKEREKEAAKTNKKPGHAKKRRLPQTPSYNSPNGLTIFVGKSAQHNDYVTFELGDKNDVWLHARGMPGSHVIIKTQGQEVPDATLEMAAELAAYYSKGQQSGKVEVTYTAQKYVRKVKGQHPGLVTYSNDHSIAVKPRKPSQKA